MKKLFLDNLYDTFFALCVVIWIICGTVGCVSTNDKAYIECMNSSLEVIIPEYLGYVSADDARGKIERDAMKKHAQELLELSREAVIQAK